MNDYFLELLYAMIGKTDLAFEWLEMAVDNYDPNVTDILIDGPFDGIRSDPRYPDILKKTSPRHDQSIADRMTW